MFSLKQLRFGFLERPLSRLCEKHARLVARYPWPFIMAPLILTGALGVGFFYRRNTKSAYDMYIPLSAPSLQERRVIAELFPPVDGAYTPTRSLSWAGECDMVVAAKDKGDILRPEYRQAVMRLNDYVMDEIGVTYNGDMYTYRNICMHFMQFCHTNPQLYAVELMLTQPGPFDNFTYPLARRGKRRFYVGYSMGAVTMDPLTSRIMTAKSWILVYQVKSDPGSVYEKVGALWQRQWEKEMLNLHDDLLDVYIFHTNSLDLELKRNSEHILLKFMGCIIMLFLFCTACTLSLTWKNGRPYVDWTLSKPVVAACGLMGAIMGVISTIGLLAFCGWQYNAVVDAMPFLVLGVRLDNTFLMIAAVQRTKRTLPTTDRIAEAMSEAAVSILITVLTDILSFAVGIFTDFLAVQLFSVYIVVAMAITYVYQLTFLLGVLVINFRAEERDAHSIVTCRKTFASTSDEANENYGCCIRTFCLGTHREEYVSHKPSLPCDNNNSNNQKSRDHLRDHEETWMPRIIRTRYAPFLMKSATRIAVLIIYLIYLAISIYGCFNLRQGLEPSRLLVTDSYVSKFSNKMTEYFWSQGAQVQVAFANAGDVSNRYNRHEIKRILSEFANSGHGFGSGGVDFWLTSYDRFLTDYYGYSLDSLVGRTEFYDKLQFFLSLEENAAYRNDLAWLNATRQDHVTAFRALIGIVDFGGALNQMETMDEFRRIASKYPLYNISTYYTMWLFADQYEQVWPNTVQELYGGTLFMILIAVFFIPSFACTFWVVAAIVSIDVGVFGLMTFWGINLDVISMICIILSMGFSVDFTAHIAYAFVVSEAENTVDKAALALGSLAWPIVQGGISTTMGVVVLAGSNSYIQVAFCKTVTIVIALGLLHGLLFLPVVLSLFSFTVTRKRLTSYLSKWMPNRNDKKVVPVIELSITSTPSAYHHQQSTG